MWTDEELDERIARSTSPEGLEQLARNVEAQSPAHAKAARRRAVQLRAAAFGATTDAEREGLEAVYAYERAQSSLKARKVHASRTWQMIARRGIIPAIEHIVTRKAETLGYRTLVEMGMEEMAFEAVVLRHPQVFSPAAIKEAEERLRTLKQQAQGDV
jgi:hypothetical protein